MKRNILNKGLWTEITRLKLLRKLDAPVRFSLDESPFDGIDVQEGEAIAAANSKEPVIIGRILPMSEIYKEEAYLIEIKLIKNFPMDPPEVRFLTPIYHPNIGKDGEFCNELLQKTFKSTVSTSFVHVVRVVVDVVDRPDIDYSLSAEVGREYMENKSKFDRKAMEYVKKYALPRF